MASPATELGLDRSGNGNNFTVAGTLGSDQMVDTPTNNFCTWNPLLETPATTGTVTFSEGNLSATTPNSGSGITISSMGATSGKYYAEILYSAQTNLRRIGFGITGDVQGTIDLDTTIGTLSSGLDVLYYSDSGNKFTALGTPGAGASYGDTYSVGDIIGIALNIDDDEVTFYKNGTAQDSGTAISFTSGGTYHFALCDASGGAGGTGILNAGQDSSFAGNKTAQGNQDGNSIGDFYYTPPTGFLALCTKNLPDVDVVPSKNFNTVLYTGTGSEQNVTGVGFQPDLTWIKERAESEQLVAVDVLSGSGVTEINPNSTAAESDDAQEVKAILSDGFTVGTSSVTNQNNATHVAWNWKAGDSSTNVSESGNNPGGTHRANQAAGISLVTYTGTGSAGTVTHGLGAAPDFIICKTRNNTGDWMVFFGDNTDFLKLNTIAPREDLAAVWNDTSPTSTVFSLGDNSDVNVDGRTYLAWCFKSTDGFSKFGTYTGNGSTNGTFIYTGFSPAFGLFKNITDNNTSWILFDNKRSTFNPRDDSLSPDTGYAEEEDYDIDFVSNGFKFRNTSSWANLGDKTYTFVAFAEVPFKYANAR